MFSIRNRELYHCRVDLVFKPHSKRTRYSLYACYFVAVVIVDARNCFRKSNYITMGRNWFSRQKSGDRFQRNGYETVFSVFVYFHFSCEEKQLVDYDRIIILYIMILIVY